jgi:cation transport regulator ChaB
MPYTISSSPVKEALPDGANKLWVKTFNAIVKDTGEEDQARRIAWNNVKNKYRKVGGKWVKKVYHSFFDGVGKEISTDSVGDTGLSSNVLVNENLAGKKKKTKVNKVLDDKAFSEFKKAILDIGGEYLIFRSNGPEYIRIRWERQRGYPSDVLEDDWHNHDIILDPKTGDGITSEEGKDNHFHTIQGYRVQNGGEEEHFHHTPLRLIGNPIAQMSAKEVSEKLVTKGLVDKKKLSEYVEKLNNSE